MIIFVKLKKITNICLIFKKLFFMNSVLFIGCFIFTIATQKLNNILIVLEELKVNVSRVDRKINK